MQVRVLSEPRAISSEAERPAHTGQDGVSESPSRTGALTQVAEGAGRDPVSHDESGSESRKAPEEGT